MNDRTYTIDAIRLPPPSKEFPPPVMQLCGELNAEKKVNQIKTHTHTHRLKSVKNPEVPTTSKERFYRHQYSQINTQKKDTH